MSVTVIHDSYSELCEDTFYGKHFLELPEHIIKALDGYFDGQTINLSGDGSHPDNIWVNSYVCLDSDEILTYQTKMLSKEEFEALHESDSLYDYIEKNEDEINNRLSETFYVLGRDDLEWHLLQ
ncbi:hypothetical protein BBG03_03425 [Streptococcus dysgalactiae subsp. equisimilis]|uniref:hypothetical protein n=1 Tax=Streptococcus dysgalactiae TaxID=1334 RepID=UPI00080711CD|nr:hypothetical protein [Streptococcus dysgalactiae]OBZ00646.1 hypothetical protein BBG03_03425 [Streptococcus dysgalactiae subsp. equisimilis]